MVRLLFGPKRGGVEVELTMEEARRLSYFLRSSLMPQLTPPTDLYVGGVVNAALAVEEARKKGKQ